MMYGYDRKCPGNCKVNNTRMTTTDHEWQRLPRLLRLPLLPRHFGYPVFCRQFIDGNKELLLRLLRLMSAVRVSVHM